MTSSRRRATARSSSCSVFAISGTVLPSRRIGQEQLRRVGLGDDGVDARERGADRDLLQRGAGEEDDLGGGRRALEARGEGQAVDAGVEEVEHDQRRRGRADHRPQRRHIADGADGDDVGLRGEHGLEPGAHRRLIVEDGDPQHDQLPAAVGTSVGESVRCSRA